MKGVNYITDEQGHKTAVVISLKDYKEEIEDFLDGLEAQSRAGEPSINFERAVSKILKTKTNNGKVSAKDKKSAEKELSLLPVQTILIIKGHILNLQNNPFPQGYKKLEGFKGLYRIRSGNYRIIYSVLHNILVIEILKIAHRKDVYR